MTEEYESIVNSLSWVIMALGLIVAILAGCCEHLYRKHRELASDLQLVEDKLDVFLVSLK